jgi:acyl-CoA synthetase (AMP-forming)/AMP-acid ligase II
MDNVMVTCREDSAVGQAIVYLTTSEIDTDILRNSIPTDTPNSKYWLPRHIVKVASLPLTPTGKADRAEARRLALSDERGADERLTINN